MAGAAGPGQRRARPPCQPSQQLLRTAGREAAAEQAEASSCLPPTSGALPRQRPQPGAASPSLRRRGWHPQPGQPSAHQMPHCGQPALRGRWTRRPADDRMRRRGPRSRRSRLHAPAKAACSGCGRR
eukprot:9487857-Pyramimonas_sp.AAC.1